METFDYSLEEAAELMKVAEPVLKMWVDKELIGEYDAERGWRISANDVQNFVAIRQQRELNA